VELSNTLNYINLAGVDIGLVALRGPMHLRACVEETHMFYLISKDPMTQYLLRIEKSFCNDNFRINFLLFFLTPVRTMIERSLSF
jgi:hypothetical protein